MADKQAKPDSPFDTLKAELDRLNEQLAAHAREHDQLRAEAKKLKEMVEKLRLERGDKH